MGIDFKKNEFWKQKLSADEYHVLRNKGTERAFSGEYWNNFEKGSYHCRACGSMLFQSESKFDAGCGWPSFDRPVNEKVIKKSRDNSLGMERVEALCGSCDGHLGHVFPDGPTETGKRYCINSLSIRLRPEGCAG